MKRRIRIRWYHTVFLLAFLEVAVILLSLELHLHTFRSVGRLVEAAAQVDERDRWFKRAEQCVLELDAPGNDVFRSGEVSHERARLQAARVRFDACMDDAARFDLKVEPLRARVNEMISAAEDIFRRFEHANDDRSAPAQRENMLQAAGAMSRMDAQQMLAMREISLLSDRTSLGLKTLLEEHEAELQSRMGYERYFIASFIVLLVGILWFGHHIQKTHAALETERLRTEAERRERLASIGELCSSVAHGIRNPLAAIRSSAQLSLELGKLDANTRGRLEDILTEGARLGDRVTGLLNISRADRSQFERVSLPDVVRDAVSGLQAELDRRGIRLMVDASQPVRVLGDRCQLEQLVIELVSNAMEQTPEGGLIHVRCRRPKDVDCAYVEVEDRGGGVPADLRNRIFDLFFTTKPSGTGIGLATVKRISRLHGGDVEVAEGEAGAKFVVTFPKAENGSLRRVQETLA